MPDRAVNIRVTLRKAFPWTRSTRESARPGTLNPQDFRGAGEGTVVPGYALVREERDFTLATGRNLLRVPEVPALIDPTTVAFASDVYLRFRNAEANGLGAPLPAGRVRVAKLDPADRSLEFIGEDLLDQTARDETVQIRLGSALDVVGERKSVDFPVRYTW